MKPIDKLDAIGEYHGFQMVQDKINEIIQVVNQLIPPPEKVWTEEEIQAAEKELYAAFLRSTRKKVLDK